MAKQILQNAKLWLDGYDLSGDISAMALDYSADMAEVTTIGDTAKQRIAGLRTVRASHQGLWDAGTGKPDPLLFDRVGSSSVIVTIAAGGAGAEGQRVWFSTLAGASYRFGAPVGDALPFSVELDSAGQLVSGTAIHNATKTANGVGTAFNSGVISSAQRGYATLHLLAISGAGAVLDVIIQSAATSAFTTPNQRGAFASAGAIGAQSISFVGPVTEPWWRASWTLAGTTPSATFVVSFGIL